MTTPRLAFQLDSASLALLRQVMRNPDRTRLGARQLGAMRHVKGALEEAERKMRRIERANHVAEISGCTILRDADATTLMVLDHRSGTLFETTPFDEVPDVDTLAAFLDSAP